MAVAEECHFTRAAKQLKVAQSGLSASIRSLGGSWSASLFLRSTRQVELTPAGRALLVEAKRALSATAAARDAVAAVQGWCAALSPSARSSACTCSTSRRCSPTSSPNTRDWTSSCGRAVRRS
ncbi:LysR family transcriptional regulator [Streptomyces sp. M19]